MAEEVAIDGNIGCIVVLQRMSPDFIQAWTSKTHVNLQRKNFLQSEDESNSKSWNLANKKGKVKKRKDKKRDRHEMNRYEVKQNSHNPNKLTLVRNKANMVRIKTEAPSMPCIDFDIKYNVKPPLLPVPIDRIKKSPQNYYEYGSNRQSNTIRGTQIKQEPKLSPISIATTVPASRYFNIPEQRHNTIKESPDLRLRNVSVRLEKLKNSDFYLQKLFGSSSQLAAVSPSKLVSPTTSAKDTPSPPPSTLRRYTEFDLNKSLTSRANLYTDEKRKHMKEHFGLKSPNLSTGSSENELLYSAQSTKTPTATVTSNALYNTRHLSSSSSGSDGNGGGQPVHVQYTSAANVQKPFKTNAASKLTSSDHNVNTRQFNTSERPHKLPEKPKQISRIINCGPNWSKSDVHSKESNVHRKNVRRISDSDSNSEESDVSPADKLRKMSNKLQNVNANKIKQMTRIPKKSMFDKDDDCLEIDINNSDDDFMKELNEIPDNVPPVDKSNKIGNKIVHKKPAVNVPTKPNRPIISFTTNNSFNNQTITKAQKNEIKERIQIGGPLLKPGENRRPKERVSVRDRLGPMRNIDGNSTVNSLSSVSTKSQLNHIHPIKKNNGQGQQLYSQRTNTNVKRTVEYARTLVEYDVDTPYSPTDDVFNPIPTAMLGRKNTGNMTESDLANQMVFHKKPPNLEQNYVNGNLCGRQFQDIITSDHDYQKTKRLLPNGLNGSQNAANPNIFGSTAQPMTGPVASPRQNYLLSFNNVHSGGQNVINAQTNPKKFSIDHRENRHANPFTALKISMVGRLASDAHRSDEQKAIETYKYGHQQKENPAAASDQIVSKALNVRDPRREQDHSSLWDLDNEQIGLTEAEMNLFPPLCSPISIASTAYNGVDTPMSLKSIPTKKDSNNVIENSSVPLKMNADKSTSAQPSASVQPSTLSQPPTVPIRVANKSPQPSTSSFVPDYDSMPNSPLIKPPTSFSYSESPIKNCKADPFGPREPHTSALLSDVCFKFLNDRCDSSACVLHHYLPTVQEMNEKLQTLEQPQCIQFYNVYLLRCRRLFTKYFSIFCSFFGKHKLQDELTQMIEDCVKREFYQYFAYILKGFQLTGMKYSEIVQYFIKNTNHTPNCNKIILKIILDHQNIEYVADFVREIDLIAVQLNHKFDEELKKKLQNICDSNQNDALCDILQKIELE